MTGVSGKKEGGQHFGYDRIFLHSTAIQAFMSNIIGTANFQ